jgi:hypothetical protein
VNFALRVHRISSFWFCKCVPTSFILRWHSWSWISEESVWNNNYYCPSWYISSTVQFCCVDCWYNIGYSCWRWWSSQQSSQKSVLFSLSTWNSMGQWNDAFNFVTFLQKSEECLFSQGRYASSFVLVTSCHHLSCVNYCHIHLTIRDWFIIWKFICVNKNPREIWVDSYRKNISLWDERKRAIWKSISQ